MSGFGDSTQRGNVDPGASWRALSGDPLPVVPNLSIPAHDGGTGWPTYPYAAQQPAQAPPYPDAAQFVAQQQPVVEPMPPVVEPVRADVVVPVEQLEPIAVPRYHAPARAARDPRQRTMAAVITFVALLIGLWGILGFLGSLSTTLSSIASGSQKLKLQQTEANKGLKSLDEKTQHLIQMDENSARMQELLTGIDKDMGVMLGGVDDIAAGMESTSAALATLDSELGKVGSINASMADRLGAINTGLASQVKQVRTMRRDVEATSRVLKSLPGRMKATNGRLAHVNNSVNIMGCGGITNNLKVSIRTGPLTTGSATVYATVVPPGAWGTKADGKTPC